MQRKKINLEKVQASLNTICPNCNYSISPSEIQRVDFDKMKCPACGERFTAKKDTPS